MNPGVCSENVILLIVFPEIYRRIIIVEPVYIQEYPGQIFHFRLFAN